MKIKVKYLKANDNRGFDESLYGTKIEIIKSVDGSNVFAVKFNGKLYNYALFKKVLQEMYSDSGSTEQMKDFVKKKEKALYNYLSEDKPLEELPFYGLKDVTWVFWDDAREQRSIKYKDKLYPTDKITEGLKVVYANKKADTKLPLKDLIKKDPKAIYEVLSKMDKGSSETEE